MRKKRNHPAALRIAEQVANLALSLCTKHELCQAPQSRRNVGQDVHMFRRESLAVHAMRCEPAYLCHCIGLAATGNAGGMGLSTLTAQGIQASD
ncbi:hypothetical protein THARTR1_02126 [Trichoderma harzianum]|uniref:Uncharacterized protein n=1 Tax=Trichoderma harzianum TaxID=5544 RepID=A0A2K0UJI9_TRIHA|nr:hypothetical protein THARTR1_02126 [Trichoderma harzianum]